MTDQQHPITPSPELVQQWIGGFFGCVNSDEPWDSEKSLATQAARWGADMELEACIKLLSNLGGDGEMIRRHRRPKPKGLAEEALKELTDWTDEKQGSGGEVFLCEGLSVVKIRRALERLQQLEDNQ